MDDKNLQNYLVNLPDGLSTLDQAQPTSFSNEYTLRKDVNLTSIDAGIVKDLTDSAKFVGFNETASGLFTKLLAPTAQKDYLPLRDEQLLSSFSKDQIIDNLGEFTSISSPEEMSQKIASIQKENRFNQEFAERDLNNIPAALGFVGGALFDVTSALPISWFKKASKSVALLEGAVSFAGAQAIRDYSSDKFMTDEQKQFNIAMAGAVGFGFGAAVVGKNWIQTTRAKELQTELVETELKRQRVADENLTYLKQTADGNVQVHETLDEWVSGGKQDVSIVEAQGGSINKTIFNFYKDKVVGKFMPKLRLYNNALGAARWAADTLTGTSLIKTRNVGTGIEHSVRIEVNNLVRKVQDVADGIYAKMMQENPSIKISAKQFKDEFYADVRYQTWDNSLPQTKYYREFAPHYKSVMERLWKQGQFSGRISKEAKLDPNEIYKPLAYNFDNITNNITLFNIKLVEASKSGIQKRISFLSGTAEESAKDEIVKLQSLLDNPKALQKVLDTYVKENILGIPTSYKPIKDVAEAEAKGFNFREFYIDDSYLKEFMNNEFDSSIQHTIRSQTVDATVATHFGDSSLNKWIDELIKERDEAILKNPDKAAFYTEQADDAVRDISAGINRLKGYNADGSLNNSTSEKVLGYLLSTTVVGLMGRSALSNIPEIGQVASKWKVLSKDTADAFVQAYKSSGVKLNKKEAKRLGYATTFIQDTRQSLLDDSPNALSKAQEIPQKVSNAAYFAYGQTFVTNTLEQYTAENLVDFIIKVANAGTRASKSELDELAKLGITKNDFSGIIKEFEANKVEVDGLTVSGIDDWSSNIGIRTRAAIQNAVRETIVAPDSLTKPIWFDKGVGRLFGQFKGFMLSAMEKYALTDLQQGGSNFTKMLVMRTIGGTLSYLAREAAVKNIEDIDLTPERIVQEGLMRGGGIVGHDFLLDIMDQFNLGSSRWLGTSRAMQRKSAYGHDPVLRTVAGAPAAVIGDITKTVINIANGNFDPEAYKHLVKYPAGHIVLQGIINRLYD